MTGTKKQRKSAIEQVKELGYNIEDIKPMHDKILVRRFKEPEKSGLIYVPEVAEEKEFHWGEVLAVGPGKRVDGYFYPTELEPGNIVMIGKYHDWSKLDADGELLILQEADVRVFKRA